MSSLKLTDRAKVEQLFDMSSGYVLDFSNRTFMNFVLESVAIDIYDEKYELYGDSKAKRLRAFWELENDTMVQKLLIDLIKHKEFMDLKKSEYDDEFVGNKSLIDECNRIAQSLIDNGADDIDVIRDLQKNNTDINRKQLLESIRKKH